MRSLFDLILQLFVAGPVSVSINDASVAHRAATDEWDAMALRIQHLEETVESLIRERDRLK